jgi:threonine dehydrogenase-like Zn-dependent dehydrogenase
LSPSVLIAVDKDAGRLEAAKKMGADHTIDAGGDVKAKVMELTDGRGCDVVIEAVGIPASFELCQDLVAFGGNIANIGVHGAPCQLHIEKLWGYNIGERSCSCARGPDGLMANSNHHGIRQHHVDRYPFENVPSRNTESEAVDHAR